MAVLACVSTPTITSTLCPVWISPVSSSCGRFPPGVSVSLSEGRSNSTISVLLSRIVPVPVSVNTVSYPPVNDVTSVSDAVNDSVGSISASLVTVTVAPCCVVLFARNVTESGTLS